MYMRSRSVAHSRNKKDVHIDKRLFWVDRYSSILIKRQTDQVKNTLAAYLFNKSST